ncbi:MAG TPA: hypothetical protein VHB20_14525 [Verrucomicrobiae bacterium]|jgi:hypothetical protein|nr:hypothetical protein [Verrucomicrobiae bacterium]
MLKPSQITYELTSDLSVYKSPVPEWDSEDPDFIALADDVHERGVDSPLICFGKRIVDGRARWRAAKRYQIKQVPTVQCEESEIATIIIRSLVNRRHLTKSALAYVSYPLMATAFEEAKQRRLQILRGATGESTLNRLSYESAEQLAQEIGVSRALFFQAADLHQKFAKKPDLRTDFEPQILSGEIGLGACIAGIAGQESTKGQKREDDSQLELFKDGLSVVATRFKYWTKFDPEQKEAAVQTIRQTVAAMPKDLRGEYARAIRHADKQEEAQ